VATEDDAEASWMPAWLALVRTHARLWDRLESQVRRDHDLTMARYDVLANVELAGGRLGLSKLASSIVLVSSPRRLMVSFVSRARRALRASSA